MSYARLRPTISPGEQDAIDAVVFAVDAQVKRFERKWGMGRLPTLVPVEWAERWHRQCSKFGEAIVSGVYPDVKKHGEAMERAMAKLNSLAEEAGHEHGPPEQWEFDTPDGLVILIRDVRRTSQVELHGRQAQVWSLDEITSVIRAHPMLAAVKSNFAEATLIEPFVPTKPGHVELDDEVPF